jgi:putative transposase
VRAPDFLHDDQQRLWLYLGGIARENKMKAFCVGGVEDHVHISLSLPSTLAVSKAVQLLNSGMTQSTTFSPSRASSNQNV